MALPPPGGSGNRPAASARRPGRPGTGPSSAGCGPDGTDPAPRRLRRSRSPVRALDPAQRQQQSDDGAGVGDLTAAMSAPGGACRTRTSVMFCLDALCRSTSVAEPGAEEDGLSPSQKPTELGTPSTGPARRRRADLPSQLPPSGLPGRLPGHVAFAGGGSQSRNRSRSPVLTHQNHVPSSRGRTTDTAPGWRTTSREKASPFRSAEVRAEHRTRRAPRPGAGRGGARSLRWSHPDGRVRRGAPIRRR